MPAASCDQDSVGPEKSQRGATQI